MATIRKRRGKWQVQVRRSGVCAISRSFHEFNDAKIWARQMEVQADRHALPTNPKVLSRTTLGEIVHRYRETVSTMKRTHDRERYSLRIFLDHPICRKRLSELRIEDFVAYRDERLKTIKPASLKRELGPIHHLFEIARDEWGLPIQENLLDKLKLNGTDKRRERRLTSYADVQ